MSEAQEVLLGQERAAQEASRRRKCLKFILKDGNNSDWLRPLAIRGGRGETVTKGIAYV